MTLPRLAVFLLFPLLAACLPARETLLPRLGLEVPALRDFPADYRPPLSAETGQPMPGFGSDEASGVHRTPVIFVHGNTVSARYWLPAREYFLKHGYSKDELWAFGYGWDNVRYFDSNELSVVSLERVVNSVSNYLSKKRGIPVRQVDIVAHSLGVTLVRQWLKQTNSYHRVRNFVGIAGANHGTWTAWSDTRGQQRLASWELSPDSPWLAQLNRGGETPGPTRYFMLYDGSGWADVFYPKPHQDSPALEGARNLPYNREHGTWFDHLRLPKQAETLQTVVEFLGEVHEPLPRAAPPRLLREGDRLRSDQAEARLYCADDGLEPGRGKPESQWTLRPGVISTCYVAHAASGLASPLARYTGAVGYEAAGELSLSASPAGGVYEQPQQVRLEASDPAAFIVYTTSGTLPDSGSPLYRPEHPLYVAAPLRLQAVAITPDGRRSPPLVLDYDISLEKVEAAHTLERQFDPSVPEQYAGRRKKGR